MSHNITREQEISHSLGRIQAASKISFSSDTGQKCKAREELKRAESFHSLLTVSNIIEYRKALDTSIPFILCGFFFTCAGIDSHEIIISPFEQRGKSWPCHISCHKSTQNNTFHILLNVHLNQ